MGIKELKVTMHLVSRQMTIVSVECELWKE
jgi:hypothetical protein